jgi:hypothetical protein
LRGFGEFLIDGDRRGRGVVEGPTTGGSAVRRMVDGVGGGGAIEGVEEVDAEVRCRKKMRWRKKTSMMRRREVTRSPVMR